MIYSMLVMTHFLPPLDITTQHVLHHPNRPPIIFIPVAMASPSLLYPQSSCAKTFCTICYTKTYINLKTYVIHVAEIVSMLCACVVNCAFATVLIKESYYYLLL